MKVSIIVAMAENRVIGHEGRIPWRLRADLRRFKRLTMGHHLIFGRRTFESVGRRLPGRIVVVATRSEDYAPEGVAVARSLDAALALARHAGETECFVGGGGEIYRQTLDRADRLYLTLVHARFEGDTYFPLHDPERWHEVFREDHEPDAWNPHPFSFIDYEWIQVA